MPVERVGEIAEGLVWVGGTARQLGLIDGFGSLDDAIAEAARRAKLDPETAEAVWLEKQPTFLERLFSSATGSGEVAVAPRDLFSRFAAKPEWMLARAVHDARQILTEIGRASCRERVCQYV